MKVLLLTQEQKDQLIDQQFDVDCYFNPIQDEDDNWIISTEERDLNTNSNFDWINDLPQIDYNPKKVSFE